MIRKSPISFLFLALCILVTFPGIFSEKYFELFSGELPHEHWWQNFTMAFQHGAVNQPSAIFVHLLLNAFLLIACGTLVERILGSKKFLLLTLTAWAGFVLAQYFSGIWINGSSGIIWAYSPLLLLPIQWSKRSESYKFKAERSRILLVVMWGLVTFAMGFVPLIFNPSHSLLYTFFFGNLFHASATLVGFIFYFFWKKNLAIPVKL